MKSSIFFLACLLTLAGCMNPAAKGPLFDQIARPAADKSGVYFLRPLENDGGTVCLNILMNDKDLGCLGTKGYLYEEMPPGKYTIKFRPNVYPAHTLFEFEIELVRGDLKFYSYKVDERLTEGTVVSRYTAGGTISVQDIEEPYVTEELNDLRDSLL